MQFKAVQKRRNIYCGIRSGALPYDRSRAQLRYLHSFQTGQGLRTEFAGWITHKLSLSVLALGCCNHSCLNKKLCVECVTRRSPSMIKIERISESRFENGAREMRPNFNKVFYCQSSSEVPF